MTELKSGIEANWDFTLVGPYWTDVTYRPLVRVIWETLDAISCTPYLATLHANAGSLALNAGSTPGWSAGDYGLTKVGAVTLDFPQLLTSYQTDPGHLARLFIHEITHAYNRDRGDNPAYYAQFLKLYTKEGKFSDYGNNANETFSEVVGFYVARCAAKNPYGATSAAYYAFAKELFGGKEFGPPPGQPVDCSQVTPDVPPAPPASPVAAVVASPAPAALAEQAPAPDALAVSSGPRGPMLRAG